MPQRVQTPCLRLCLDVAVTEVGAAVVHSRATKAASSNSRLAQDR